MKVKYIVLAVLAMFSFSGCDEEYAKVPFTVPVDFSKKGTVYETNFQAPWNIWGSLVEFYILILTPDLSSSSSDEERKIRDYINNGHPQKTTPYFKVKITLTPLGWTSNDVTAWTGTGEAVSKMTKKEFTDGLKIEFVVSVPLYGGDIGRGKTIMIADLQRLRNYHIKVESLEDVEVPKDVKTSFGINRASRKY